MTSFALLHGAWHSGWHWGPVIDELLARGQVAFAPDLPIDDAGAGALAFADAVARHVGSARVDVVVGHSLNGLVVPVVAERLSARLQVYLAAMVPVPGQTAEQSGAGSSLRDDFSANLARLKAFGDGSTGWDPADAADAFFDELPRPAALAAAGRLRRQHYAVWNEACPLDGWPDIPSAYIVCRADRTMDADHARRVCADRLHVTAVEIDGGHSPFLARPAELADLLIALATELVGQAQPGA